MTQINGALSSFCQASRVLPQFTGGLHETSWFAIQTKPRHEKSVAARLEEKAVIVFLPLFSAQHQWSDRKRTVQVPLFTNYVFVRIGREPGARISILRTNGVVSFVGRRGAGVPIPDDELQAVRTILREGVSFLPYPFFNVGQRVRIRGGALDGIEGTLLAANGDRSLVVSIKSIERSIAIRIAGYQVELA